MSETNPKSEPLPSLRSDEEAERFVDEADLSRYDLSGFRPLSTYEFGNKDKAISLRLPTALYEALKARADHEGLSYQRFMRRALEQALHQPPGR